MQDSTPQQLEDPKTKSQNKDSNLEVRPKRIRLLVIYALLCYILLAFGLAYSEIFSSIILIIFVITPLFLLVYSLTRPRNTLPAISELPLSRSEKLEPPNTTIRAFIKAVIGGVVLYYTLIIGAYITFGIYLLQIEEWTSFSEPIPPVDTLHLVAISILFSIIIYRRQSK